VVINDFHIVSVTVFPDETNSPLIIDADAVLANPITFKKLQAISWRTSQVGQDSSPIQHPQFSESYLLNALRKLS
jgi:hypothetical protein